MAEKALIGLVCLIIGYAYGYGRAHIVVAQECKKLGRFFVMSEVYHCTLIEKADSGKDGQ